MSPSNRGRSPRRPPPVRAGVTKVGADVVCGNAANAAVVDAFARLGPITGPGQILDAAGDDAACLAGDQVSHLMEAWQYLGAALRSVLCNAGDNAIHFAYYAQLRAAVSIFAGSGVRLRMGDNYYLDRAGARFSFQLSSGDRTHEATWAVWKEWVRTPFAQQLLSSNVSIISGVTLSDLMLVPTSPGALLTDWGYDLARGRDDHHARIEASYHAKARQPSPVMDEASVELVSGIWSLLMESGGGVVFDATLVRYFVEKYLAQQEEDEVARGGVAPDRAATLGRIIAMTSGRIGVPTSTLDKAFEAEVDLSLFDIASSPDKGAANVVCRALFLVRVATLALSENLKANGDECKKWLVQWLASAGLYDQAIHEEPKDLAVDYGEALDELNDIDMAHLPFAIWRGRAAEASALLSRPEGFIGWALPLTA